MVFQYETSVKPHHLVHHQILVEMEWSWIKKYMVFQYETSVKPHHLVHHQILVEMEWSWIKKIHGVSV